MNYQRDPWQQYSYDLEKFEREIKELTYTGAFSPPPDPYARDYLTRDIPVGGITLEQIADICAAAAVGTLHGLELLRPVDLPKFPKVPARPSGQPNQYQEWISEKGENLSAKLASIRQTFQGALVEEAGILEQLKTACESGQPEAVILLMKISYFRHLLPRILMLEPNFSYDFGSKIILANIEIPAFSRLRVVKKRGNFSTAKWLPVSAIERRRSLELVLFSLCIRSAYLVARSDFGGWFDTIAVNAKQKWFDPATGAPREGIIASLQAPKVDLIHLQIGHLEPKACFRHLKGVATPSIEQVSSIKPIFVMDMHDGRVVANRDVADSLDQETNLAAMPWEDFEHLVRQLFEWEFGRNGVEVKVTRASRDRGVDAIMFDPDPLRGGKYILQAKRYTRTVDVAAVRDLYGAVMNEGANRGILVTTSSYGPDSYDFAKDKPISLVDGPNLVAMLKRHGRAFRIDLAGARRLDTQSN